MQQFNPILVLVGATGMLFVLYLVGFYRANTEEKQPGTAAGDFEVRALGPSSLWRLALVSFLGLFLELLMIRWISSEIRIFAYFKNLVLIACFLGFGLGCYYCRRRMNLIALSLPLLLIVLVVKAPWWALHSQIISLPQMIGATSDAQIWGVTNIRVGWYSIRMLIASLIIILPLIAMIALVFVPIGQLVGRYLEDVQGIAGYTVNVLGSLAGIVAYTVVCLFSLPPAAWFAIAGAAAIAVFWRVPRLRWGMAAVFAGCVALASLGPADGSRIYWSPYQKLGLLPIRMQGETVAYRLNTNDSWYQRVINLSPEFVNSHRQLTNADSIAWNAYNIPYHFQNTPGSVLVLGAGMGNDVAAALRNGAGRVVAVEIDPLILQLGRELHFEHPYESARVRPVVDDARSYIQNSDERFDLIVFSLLDSHTTSSHFSNIRIDNYVYTVEALAAAKRLLRDNGIFIVKFQVESPWIAARLRGLLENVFRQAPLQLKADYTDYTTSGMFFIVGSQERIQAALRDPALSAYVARHQASAPGGVTLTTDDWPYFYQRQPGLPLSVIVISILVVAMGWAFLRTTSVSAAGIRWHFFYLGAAFLLLEAQIISKMALLFGTTWLVNSIVIAGLLLLIVASNFVVQRLPQFPLGWAYAGIAFSVVLTYLVPIQALFVRSLWLRALVATMTLCLPVFFAGIVFVRSFAAAGFRGECLGSNLLGSLVGGVLESLSFLIGLKALVLLAGVLYAASALTLPGKPEPKRVLAASAAGDD